MQEHLCVILSVIAGGGVDDCIQPPLPLVRSSFKDKRFVERLDRSGEPGYWSGLLNQDGLTFYSRHVFFLFWSLMTVTYSSGPPPVLRWWRWDASQTFISKATPRWKVFLSFFFFLPLSLKLDLRDLGGGGGLMSQFERQKRYEAVSVCYRPISWKYESQSKRRGFGDMTA